jgi:hypothetical protein
MPDVSLERRRSPRVPIYPGTEVGVPMALTVRLVDISANGVLLSSPQKMLVGQRARLQLTLSGEPLNVELEVRRVSDGGNEVLGRNRYRLGAVFVTPDEVARRSVQHFLRDDAS